VDSYGFLGVVDAPNAKTGNDRDFDAFRSGRRAALRWPVGGHAVYRTSKGQTVEFSFEDNSGKVLSIDGTAERIYQVWPSAEGGVVNRGLGPVTTIRNPASGMTRPLW
jgi:hypothetical protein